MQTIYIFLVPFWEGAETNGGGRLENNPNIELHDSSPYPAATPFNSQGQISGAPTTQELQKCFF
jgi:hypothetical protein